MAFIIMVYGLLIGSFLNVVIYRLPKNESIVFPGSHCTICNHNLAWFDNIPVISYMLLKGKCRYCKTRISPKYPIIELLNSFFYLLFYMKYGFNTNFFMYSLIFSVLLAITLIDLIHQLIPDSLVAAIVVITILFRIVGYYINSDSLNILDSLSGSLVAGGLFLLIVLISKGGMGGGDVTLISSLGFVLGLKGILVTIFISFIIGSIVSVLLLSFKLKTRKDPIPFGPFIVIGFLITLLYGDQLIIWYTNLLLY